MNACHYVCMYVCMYACMYACMHVCMYACICVSKRACVLSLQPQLTLLTRWSVSAQAYRMTFKNELSAVDAELMERQVSCVVHVEL